MLRQSVIGEERGLICRENVDNDDTEDDEDNDDNDYYDYYHDDENNEHNNDNEDNDKRVILKICDHGGGDTDHISDN